MHAKSIVRKAASLISSVSLLAAMIPSAAFAGTLTDVTYTLHNQKISVGTVHEIRFTAESPVLSGGTITVTLPAGFTISGLDKTNSEITVSGTGSGTTLTSVSASGQVITAMTATDDIDADDDVTLRLGTNDTEITNPSSAGSYPITIQTSGGDSVGVSVAIINDGDVAVSASVIGSMSLTLADNTAALGTLSPLAIKTVTKENQIVVGSNAPGGFDLIPMAMSTLTSGSDTIALYESQTASSPGTARWGIKFTEVSHTGDAAIDTTYDDAGSYRLPLYTGPVPAVTSSGISSATYSVVYGANISSSTPAGEYTATVRYVMYGRF